MLTGATSCPLDEAAYNFRFECQTAVVPGNDKAHAEPPHSRGAIPPESCKNSVPRKTEGAGNAGRQPHPQPGVREIESTPANSPQVQSDQSGIPRAMVLTAYFVLSPVTGLYCHRRSQTVICDLSASVGAPEPHDFADAPASFVLRHQRVHRIPRPTSVTIAIRPSYRVRDSGEMPAIAEETEAKYFCRQDWTTQISLNRLAKLRFWRTRSLARSPG